MKVTTDTKLLRRDMDDLKKLFGEILEKVNELEQEIGRVSDHVDSAIDDIDEAEDCECEESWIT